MENKALPLGLRYVAGSTFFHKVHPFAKLVLLISFSLLIFAMNHFLAGTLLFAILLASFRFAGLGLSFFWQKLRIICIFSIFIILVQILFYQQGTLLWSFNLLGIQLTIWSAGIMQGLGMALRFINIIASSYLFIATTDPNKLAYALMQAGLPYRQGFMLITALRFIPVFEIELAQVRNAQMAKGINMKGLSIKKFLRIIRYLFVPLVISALGKIDSLTVSMEGRAFGLYNTRTFMTRQRLSHTDWLIIIASPIFFLILYFTFQLFI